MTSLSRSGRILKKNKITLSISDDEIRTKTHGMIDDLLHAKTGNSIGKTAQAAVQRLNRMEDLCLKAKKHKRKHNHETERETVEIDDITENTEMKAKKKKKKSRHTKSDNEACAIEVKECNTKNEADLVNNLAISRKRKLSDTDDGAGEKKSKKKTKRKHCDMQEQQSDESEALHTENVGNSEIISELNTTKSKKKKSKKKKFDIESDLSTKVEDQDQIGYSVKHAEQNESDLLEKTEDNTLELKLKKKHKKKKKKNVQTVEESTEILNEADQSLDSGMKKKRKKDNKKERNIDRHQEETDTQEIMHENNLEKQDVIDQTTKTETKIKHLNTTIANTVESANLKTGQWSSVELGDSERQNKFFKLLGGFKKGNDASQLQNKFGLGKKTVFNPTSFGSKKVGGNFAMNKKQEDVYTKSLESEYDRAMAMNLNRGIGLGFEKPPDEGKKFYIDTKSSRSVKFDD